MKYLAAILMVFLLVGSSGAQEITIDKDTGKYGFTWTANSEPDLAGYRLYRSATSGQYTYGEANALATYPVSADPESGPILGPHQVGTFYFVLTAFDTEGHESGPSNEQTLIVADEAPKAPSGCAILKF